MLAFFYQGPIWSTVSIASAVFCANLPMLKPLLSSSAIPAPIKNLYCFVKSAITPGKSRKDGGLSSYSNFNASNDDMSLTIGGTAGWKQSRKGTKDLYPLHSFNASVGEITMENERGSRS